MGRNKKVKKEAGKKSAAKGDKGQEKKKWDHHSSNPAYGGIPARDFKKNLGCG